ncbi:hypothetical protein CHS0354_023883 [Potamilus streckersoni]|uniref:Acetyl-CoA C-acyltransferase n=1 Tax=Potamilus streckersoni TaxID=2493646 RepID=A0AAE0RZ83_9BIVA|nr:hypothetical protein CHS0354_023883 [Potamilus streckersoni]
MNAFIVGGYRTAVTKSSKGGFRHIRADELAARVIKELVSSLKIDVKEIDDVIVGNATPEAEQGLQIGRMISLMSLGIEVGGVTVNRYCASGLEAIAIASARISCNQADCIIAGGTESMTQLPMGGYKFAPSWSLAGSHGDYYLSMGLTAELVAKEFKISREDADMFAFSSHQKALQAIKQGKFRNQIVAVDVEAVEFIEGERRVSQYRVTEDEGPRSDTNLEVLSKLKPVFASQGVVTAGNSSQTSDGAAFVAVMSERMMLRMGLKPEARLMSYSIAGVEPRTMGIGPTLAVPKALKQAGLALKDVSQIELNEAFSAQALAVGRTLDIDFERINVNGGAVALGHPLGCTGAKLTIQLIHEMRSKKEKFGMVTACVGGGQGVADRKGSIVNQDINVSLDATMTESQIRSLRPTIVYSGLSITPSPDIPQDFSDVVTYVVESESGNKLTYRVNIGVENVSREANLSSFSLNLESGLFNGTIEKNEGNTINFSFPFGTNLKGIIPIIQISPNATINPPIDTQMDFYDDTKQRHYVVTAQDKTTYNVYSVSISYTPITFGLVGGATQLGSTAFATVGALFQVGGLKDNPLWKYTLMIDAYTASGTLSVTGGTGRINNPFSESVWKTIALLIGIGRQLPVKLKLSIEGLTHEKTYEFNNIQIGN